MESDWQAANADNVHLQEGRTAGLDRVVPLSRIGGEILISIVTTGAILLRLGDTAPTFYHLDMHTCLPWLRIIQGLVSCCHPARLKGKLCSNDLE